MPPINNTYQQFLSFIEQERLRSYYESQNPSTPPSELRTNSNYLNELSELHKEVEEAIAAGVEPDLAVRSAQVKEINEFKNTQELYQSIHENAKKAERAKTIKKRKYNASSVNGIKRLGQSLASSLNKIHQDPSYPSQREAINNFLINMMPKDFFDALATKLSLDTDHLNLFRKQSQALKSEIPQEAIDELASRGLSRDAIRNLLNIAQTFSLIKKDPRIEINSAKSPVKIMRAIITFIDEIKSAFLKDLVEDITGKRPSGQNIKHLKQQKKTKIQSHEDESLKLKSQAKEDDALSLKLNKDRSVYFSHADLHGFNLSKNLEKLAMPIIKGSDKDELKLLTDKFIASMPVALFRTASEIGSRGVKRSQDFINKKVKFLREELSETVNPFKSLGTLTRRLFGKKNSSKQKTNIEGITDSFFAGLKTKSPDLIRNIFKRLGFDSRSSRTVNSHSEKQLSKTSALEKALNPHSIQTDLTKANRKQLLKSLQIGIKTTKSLNAKKVMEESLRLSQADPQELNLALAS